MGRFFTVILLLLPLLGLYVKSPKPGDLPGRGAHNDSTLSREQIAMDVEEMPVFEGNFPEFLNANIQYPVEATQKGVQGKVYIQFTVNTDGTVSDIRVAKGVGYGCDEEAVRVIQRTSGLWVPGKQFGKPVRVRFTQPINFILVK